MPSSVVFTAATESHGKLTNLPPFNLLRFRCVVRWIMSPVEDILISGTCECYFIWQKIYIYKKKKSNQTLADRIKLRILCWGDFGLSRWSLLVIVHMPIIRRQKSMWLQRQRHGTDLPFEAPESTALPTCYFCPASLQKYEGTNFCCFKSSSFWEHVLVNARQWLSQDITLWGAGGDSVG